MIGDATYIGCPLIPQQGGRKKLFKTLEAKTGISIPSEEQQKLLDALDNPIEPVAEEVLSEFQNISMTASSIKQLLQDLVDQQKLSPEAFEKLIKGSMDEFLKVGQSQASDFMNMPLTHCCCLWPVVTNVLSMLLVNLPKIAEGFWKIKHDSHT